MAKVTPDKSQNIDKMLRNLKRKVMDDGILPKVRERSDGYDGPSVKRKKKDLKALKNKRNQKKGGYKNGNNN